MRRLIFLLWFLFVLSACAAPHERERRESAPLEPPLEQRRGREAQPRPVRLNEQQRRESVEGRREGKG